MGTQTFRLLSSKCLVHFIKVSHICTWRCTLHQAERAGLVFPLSGLPEVMMIGSVPAYVRMPLASTARATAVMSWHAASSQLMSRTGRGNHWHKFLQRATEPSVYSGYSYPAVSQSVRKLVVARRLPGLRRKNYVFSFFVRENTQNKCQTLLPTVNITELH